MNCTPFADLTVGSFLGPLPSNTIRSMVSMKTPKSIQRAQTSFLSARSANVTTYSHFHSNVPNVPKFTLSLNSTGKPNKKNIKLPHTLVARWSWVAFAKSNPI